MGQPSGGGGLWDLSTLIGEQPAGAPPPGAPVAAPLFPSPPVPPPSPVPMPPPVSFPVPPPPPPPVPPAAAPLPQPMPQSATSPTRVNRTTMVVAAGIAIVAALAITVVTVLADRPSAATPSAGVADTAPPAAVQRYPTDNPPTAVTPTDVTPTDVTPTDVTPTGPAPTVDAQAAALTELRRLHDQDAGTVRFSGQYVAQLASKNDGIVDQLQTAADGTHTFRATDILTEHMTLRQGDNQGATVVLLLSTDYGKRQLYNGVALWVTVALAPFGSATDVNAWCANRFPALSGTVLQDQCTPRRLEPASA